VTEYYRAYEERYRIVREAFDGLWGHSDEDKAYVEALDNWVNENSLSGKRVIEFACGEGMGAVILSDAGCIYHGVDIAPTALEMAHRLAGTRKNVTFDLLDMVKQSPSEGEFDAALDVSGLHMLVTDVDRNAYLKNVFRCLKPGGCAMFWQESYRCDAYEGMVESIAQWEKLTGLDFNTPEPRRIGNSGKEVMIKLLPARPRTETGYRTEMEKAGFVVDEFNALGDGSFMSSSAAIKVHKPL
jgi:ubiquinone/menaquinone biosynthesis C-methylase UbiE